MDKEWRKNPQPQRRSKGAESILPTNVIKDILRGDSEKMISFAESFAEKNLKGKSSSSIRKIYSEVKKMNVFDKYKLDLLRAKLAYVSNRHKELGNLTYLLDTTIKEVKEESFKYFKDFFEAVLAYFYKYGRE